jgi:hypothetical protein
MLQDQFLQLKAQIEHEERLYRAELETTQRIETLKTIRLRISTLKQQLSELNGKPFVGLSTIILTLSLCPN